VRAARFALIALAVAGAACGSGGSSGGDVASLIADLKGTDPEKKGRASVELIAVGEAAVPPLVEMLKSADAGHRATAAQTLFALGPRARDAAGTLGEALSDREQEVRVAAAMALESIGPGAAPAVRPLMGALKDPDGMVRQRAAMALGAIGPPAAEAIPALNEAAKWDPVRPAADEAIRKIRGR
jgi:HEAT repeat protein